MPRYRHPGLCLIPAVNGCPDYGIALLQMSRRRHPDDKALQPKPPQRRGIAQDKAENLT